MPHLYADRVMELTESTGPGNVSLKGAAGPDFVTFAARIGVGNSTDVCMRDRTSGEWEVFRATVLTATTLQRGTLHASSTGARVSFASGPKEIFCCLPATQVMVREEIEAALAYEIGRQRETLVFALSDTATALTTGAKISFPWPFTMALEEVFIGVGTKSSSGVVRVDMEIAASSIFATRPAIDAGENTSLTGTPAVLSTTSIPKGTMVTFAIDDAGTGAKELYVIVNGRRA